MFPSKHFLWKKVVPTLDEMRVHLDLSQFSDLSKKMSNLQTKLTIRFIQILVIIGVRYDVLFCLFLLWMISNSPFVKVELYFAAMFSSWFFFPFQLFRFKICLRIWIAWNSEKSDSIWKRSRRYELKEMNHYAVINESFNKQFMLTPEGVGVIYGTSAQRGGTLTHNVADSKMLFPPFADFGECKHYLSWPFFCEVG